MKETIKNGEPIGQNIRKIRKKKDLTMEEVGDKAKLSQSYLSEIETGQIKSPGIDVVRRIAEALNVGLDELVGMERKQRDSEVKKVSIGNRGLVFGSPKALDELEIELDINETLYTSAIRLVNDVLTDQSLPPASREELAKEIISIMKWAQKWLREKTP